MRRVDQTATPFRMSSKMENDRSFRSLRDSVARLEPVENQRSSEKDSDEIEFVEFTGEKVVCQVRIPGDMRKALQHHALKNDWTFSETVQHFIRSNDMCRKAHVSVTSGSIKRGTKAA